MSAPSRSQVLNLYKKLLRYSQNLQFTEKEYYLRRIRQEFLNSKTSSAEDAAFQLKVRDR